MTWKIDHEIRIILKFEGKHVASYQALVLDLMYHFKKSEVRVTLKWLKRKYESIDFLTIMKGWWSKGNFRSNPTPSRWRNSKLL